VGREKAMVERRAKLPLADVTVIDLGQIFQGPYATLLMAKVGAFVIKIEPPKGEPGAPSPARVPRCRLRC
jgi:crotonobetainyl-CoA:carnitine CoA-transferase CaiB-like acyl-CoA transferase